MRRRFLKNILPILNTCKNGFPYCGPIRPPGIMIWINLNLHYVWELSCKFQLFWSSSSSEITASHFYIIFPLKKTWPFIWTILSSLHPRMLCTKFDWNWPASSREDCFKKIEYIHFYSFAIIFPWAWALPFIWTILNPLSPKMICAKSDLNWFSGPGEVKM
jgi:hypothetical protein